MKKLFTILALCGFVVCANAQFTEDFTTEPTGWSTIDADGDGYNWTYAEAGSTLLGADGAGGGMIYSQSYDNSVGALTPDNWLVMPSLIIGSNATLTFKVCGQDASYAAEHYGVYISNSGTAVDDFTVLMEATIGDNAKDQSPWETITVDLSGHTGFAYLAFRHFNVSDMFVLDLDEVAVSNSTVGVPELSSDNSINIYPNPATNMLNIDAVGYDNYQITNILGQVVVTDAISNQAQVNVSNLNDGVYFVRLSGENGVYTQKFIKK